MGTLQVDANPLPRWSFPEKTNLVPESEYVDLEVVDISSLLHGESSRNLPAARESIAQAFRGFQKMGFIVLTGHGLTAEAIQRQIDLCHMCLTLSEKTKQEYPAKPHEEGSWAGYKPQGFYKRSNGTRDTTEFHDFYPETVVKGLQPPETWPYLDEIKAFYKYNHFTLLRTVLFILADGLGIPPDSFWNLHCKPGMCSDDIQTRDLLRQALYRTSQDAGASFASYSIIRADPPTEEDRAKSNGLWLRAHVDRGSLTFLYSQPIAGLQVFVNGAWKYVRHYPNGILVNLGDAIEFTTGGLLKAALHRVHEPPPDQRHFRRLNLFYFATMLHDTPLKALDILADRAKPPVDGVFDEFNGGVPTAGEWQIQRAKVTGKPADQDIFRKRFPEAVDTADQ